jgi:hypothetical protein
VKAPRVVANAVLIASLLAPSQDGLISSAEAASTSTLRLQLFAMDAKNKVVPASDIALFISTVEPNPSTNAKGIATLRLAAGKYTLDTVSGRRCHFEFTIAQGKDLELDLLVPNDGAAACQKYSAAPAAIGASGAPPPASASTPKP